uniref:hypothetical protein n=1 Tax=Cupriavidus taiwanensis TaxID=164546 RepID=UPI000E2EB890|nr:hypothetical protein [Cupriavidus taiwanensis]
MEIDVEVDGRRYVAQVHKVDGVITVITEDGGMETTSLGGSSAESMARILLRRMVKNGKASPQAT